MLWGVSLRQHVLPVSRTTRRKNGGIVTVRYLRRRRSSNGLIKGQGVVREMVRVSEWACISSISPMYLTLHHLPFRDIEDELAGLYERMSFQHEQLQYGQLPLNSTLYR